MKRYNITVNGNAYDVAVEEVDASSTAAPVAATPVAPAKPAATPNAAAPTVAGGTKVTAPMPGNILDVKVKVGDTVKNGTALVILEAMKMENDVVSSVDGTVASINVKKGDTVDSGALIAVIK